MQQRFRARELRQAEQVIARAACVQAPAAAVSSSTSQRRVKYSPLCCPRCGHSGKKAVVPGVREALAQQVFQLDAAGVAGVDLGQRFAVQRVFF